MRLKEFQSFFNAFRNHTRPNEFGSKTARKDDIKPQYYNGKGHTLWANKDHTRAKEITQGHIRPYKSTRGHIRPHRAIQLHNVPHRITLCPHCTVVDFIREGVTKRLEGCLMDMLPHMVKE